MSIEIKVPTIACEGCAETIIQAIESQQSEAKVAVDVANKIVTVDTSVTEAEIKSIIVAAGHTPE